MKKSLLLVAFAATAFASCSYDEVVDVKVDEIAFSVVADNQTRAEEVYCQNHLMDAFDVYGTYFDGTNISWYMKGDHIEYDGQKWNNKTTTRYWSENGTHNFYAIVNGKMATSSADVPPTVNDFIPAKIVANQQDLLYAVATDKKKSDAQVALNFRHALSQIEFRAMNTNPQLYVVIKDVCVGQTPCKGTFTFPNASTDDNFVDHTQTDTHEYATGTWALANEIADYTVNVGRIEVSGTNNPIGLTLSTDVNDENRDFSKSMLLLPTSSITGGTTAWTPSKEERAFDGTYLAVNCEIYNVAGEKYEVGDAQLHKGWAVMPVSFNWEPGKKYIYTFIFGTGNGGYDGGDPDPDPDPTPDPTPDPVLTPITYTVTVDDFQKGEDQNVDMKY